MSRAAIRYAKAILDQGQVQGAVEAIQTDLQLIGSTIASNSELADFLANPTVKDENKLNALIQIFAQATGEVKNLFKLLHENKRFEILPAITVEFGRLYDELKGVQKVVVTTAVALTSDMEAQVLSKIKSLTPKTIAIENVIDQSIIGGFIIRIGDQQYNASIASRLQNLKREFSN